MQTLAADVPVAERNKSEITPNQESAAISYRLSAGDKLRILVFGEDDLKLDALVGEDGNISYPFLGDIKVAGLTMQGVEALITKGLKGSFLINPDVNVSILEYRPFFINGEVKNPGGYPYQPSLTLRKAIALAGGLTTRASLDLASLIKEKDPEKVSEKISLDSVINPGDIVTIQPYKQVFIEGEVKKPGSFDYQPGLTLHKVISLAGGFTERADKDKIFVIHEEDQGIAPTAAELDDEVQPGDIVTIKQSFF